MAASLLGVYCMYLLFFQGFLVKPFNETTYKFKKSFSHKVTLPKRSSSEVAHYSQLSKSIVDKNPSKVFNTHFSSHTSHFANPVLQPALTQFKSQKNLRDDSYRLYLRWQAMLV
ncbi:MAG: hypothetical protein KA149_09570 [Chitinophagales bacterium]|nr:hypothetical protein [Chitinophagales bacterium]